MTPPPARPAGHCSPPRCSRSSSPRSPSAAIAPPADERKQPAKLSAAPRTSCSPIEEPQRQQRYVGHEENDCEGYQKNESAVLARTRGRARRWLGWPVLRLSVRRRGPGRLGMLIHRGLVDDRPDWIARCPRRVVLVRHDPSLQERELQQPGSHLEQQEAETSSKPPLHPSQLPFVLIHPALEVEAEVPAHGVDVVTRVDRLQKRGRAGPERPPPPRRGDDERRGKHARQGSERDDGRPAGAIPGLKNRRPEERVTSAAAAVKVVARVRMPSNTLC